MKNLVKNSFLDQVCAQLKEERAPGTDKLNYTLRVEEIAGAPFVTLWFRTRGCRHDASGGCTMCNYGISSPVTTEQMVEYVHAGLSTIPENQNLTLLVSPSGSMLDDWEVPEDARANIFRLVNACPGRTYLCETRAETVTEQRVRQLAQLITTKVPCVEMGLESADPWIMRYCINKKLAPNLFVHSTELLHKYGVRAVANILVGAPFLSPREAIDDAVRTVEWAIAQGVDNCVLFPVHVKQWTLVEWLWRHGYYSPPSLWSLIEVLARVGPTHSSRTTISWYKIYSEKVAWGELDPAVEWGYLLSPTSCPRCRATIMQLLDEYRDTNSYDVVRKLTSIECECKDIWRATLAAAEHETLPQRVARLYGQIGRDLLGDAWWDVHGPLVLSQLSNQ